MFAPATFTAALIMTILSAVFWGSWANAYKWTKRYRFELFYWDYTAGVVILALVFAFTLGSRGAAGQPFLANVRAADASNLLFALLAGFIFNIANLLLVAGIALAGLAVAFPISIGIAVIEGVVLSYAIQPKGDPRLLAAGVVLAIAAIIFDALAYHNLSASGRAVSRKGILINIVSGLLMGAFAPFVTKAITAGHALTPYSIMVFFSLGALASCIVFNTYLMRHPLIGSPTNFSGFRSADASNHVLGVVGGIVWGLGGSFNFIAGSFVGMAISYAIGQSSPMIAALWGVLVFKEFSGAGKKAWGYLTLMFVCYIAAICVIAKA